MITMQRFSRYVGALLAVLLMFPVAAAAFPRTNLPQRHANVDDSVIGPTVTIDPVGLDYADFVFKGPGPAPVFAPDGGGDGSGGLLPPLVGADSSAGVGTYTAARGSRGGLAGTSGRLDPVAGTYGPLPGGGYGGTPIPEPTSALLLLAGGLAVAAGRRRRLAGR